MNSIGVLLDLENVLHRARLIGPDAVRAGLTRIMAQLRELGPVTWAVGSCDWWLARTLLPVAAACRVRVHPGPCGQDRADGELLRRSADVPASVGTLVIASGDACFLTAVAEHRAAGRRVVVAAEPGSLSAELALAADDVVLLGRSRHLARDYSGFQRNCSIVRPWRSSPHSTTRTAASGVST